jgi:hypothetical protein
VALPPRRRDREDGGVPTLDPDRAADAVGAVTLAIGAALTVAPERAAVFLGLGPHPVLARVVGAADLAIGSALLRDRPRWPWMAARAGLTLVLATCYQLEMRRPGGDNLRTRIGAVTMTNLAVVDGGLAAVLAYRRA